MTEWSVTSAHFQNSLHTWSGTATGRGSADSLLAKPITPASQVFSPSAECTVSTDGDRALHDKYLCWLLMLMASLQTAVKNVDVTDPLNKSLEPSFLHPVLLIGGSKRKTERLYALRPCQASRGHCGALTLKLNVLSTHITIHSHTPRHCSQAFWNQISQMRKHMTMRAVSLWSFNIQFCLSIRKKQK